MRGRRSRRQHQRRCHVPVVPGAGQLEADTARSRHQRRAAGILIIEGLNPLTGGVPGHNPRKRQLLRLLSGPNAAEAIHDPVTNTWLVRLHWRDEDQLRFDYSFDVLRRHRRDGCVRVSRQPRSGA
jgi:hypothetical protein